MVSIVSVKVQRYFLLNYFDINKLRINLPTENDFGDMQEKSVNFKDAWHQKPLDKNKQISKILSILKSKEGATIVKNKTEKNKNRLYSV